MILWLSTNFLANVVPLLHSNGEVTKVNMVMTRTFYSLGQIGMLIDNDDEMFNGYKTNFWL
jgi:hypothetical protein